LKIGKIADLPVGRLLAVDLFVLSVLFQVFLVTRLAVLYHVLKAVFFTLLLLLALGLIRLARREKLLLLGLVALVAVRLPYYAHPTSLLFSSDNALEALQPLEIQDAKAAPFFLLDSSGHNGTLKYLCVAFLWDVLGTDFLTFLLFQLLIYGGFLVLLYDLLRRIFDERTVLLLVLTQFAFIEVLFDYSLFLRAAPYLEMLFFFVLGLRLFDFTFRDPRRVFAAVYFFMIAFYLHSLAVFLIVPGVLTAVLYAAKGRSLLRAVAGILAGAVAGLGHLFYYKLFYPPPPPSTWYKIHFFPLADFSLERLPAYLAQIGRDFWISFHHILSYEFTYNYGKWDGFDFYFSSRPVKTLLYALDRTFLYLALAVLAAALVLAAARIVRRRVFETAARDWIYPFLWLLVLVLIGKFFILSPSPYYEPRHNIDLAFLLVLAFVIVGDAVLKAPKVLSAKSLAVIGLSTLFAAPHYFTFLKVAAFKQRSYEILMPALEANGIRYLNTDFSLAYIIHFLSGRKIKVTDSVGPTTIDFFYYWMREELEAVPEERMAYIFLTDKYPWEEYLLDDTRRRMNGVLTRLKDRGIPYRIYDLKWYLLVVPGPSRFRDVPERPGPAP